MPTPTATTLPAGARLLVHYKAGNPNRVLDLGPAPVGKGTRKVRRLTRHAISGRTMRLQGLEAEQVLAAIEALPPKARAGFNLQVVLERVAEVAADVAEVAPHVLEVVAGAAEVVGRATTGDLGGAVTAGAELARDAAELGAAVEHAVADDKGKPRAPKRDRS